MSEFDFYAGGIKVVVPTRLTNLEEVLEQIRNGAYKDEATNIRAHKGNVKAIAFHKKKLDYVTFSGTFAPIRAANNIVAHSGLVVIDFDHLVDAEALKLQFSYDKYINACFVSPSGEGLKVIVKIKDTDRHKEVFADLAYYFNNVYRLTGKEKVDPSGSDCSRACFMSYDPTLFYNPDSTPYTIQNKIQEKPKTVQQVAKDASELEKWVAVLVDRVEANTMDICNDYGQEWLLIAFSLSVLGEAGRPYFHRISVQNAKYDERDTDSKFDNAIKTSRFTTIAKFVSICKEYGIDVSAPKTEKPSKENLSENSGILPFAASMVVGRQKASIADIQKEFKVGYNRAGRIMDQLQAIGIVGAANGTEPREIKFRDVVSLEEYMATVKLPEPEIKPETDLKPKKKKKTDEDWDSTVWYEDGGMKIKGGKYWDEVAPNFQVFIKYRTEDEQENVTWVLQIKKTDDTEIFMEVIHDDFCSARKLKNMMATKRLGFKIKDGHLDELHSYLFTKTQFNTAMKVVRYGYHPDSKVYFFANKALNLKTGEMLTPDEFGIVEANKLHLSIPQQTKLRQMRYTLTDQEITFKQFWDLYAVAHLRENAFLPVCFYIFSLFRDMGLQFKNFSPILFLKGGAGTGKSSMIRILTAAFGRKQEGVNLKSKNTDSALVKLMSQTSNSIIWFDEFHNDLTNEGLLQAAYDNDGYHKSTTDFNSIDTATVDIHSALALTSNYLPENQIFFSRCLFVPITAQNKTDEQRKAFYTLEDIQEGGLGCITVELLKHRPILQANDNYGISYNRIYAALKKKFKGQSVPERLFANISQVMAAPYTLQVAGKINLLEIVSDDELEILDEYITMGEIFIMRQWRIMNDSKAVAEFFEIVQMLFDEHKIHEEFHFRFSGESVLINFRKLYNLFSQKYRQIFYKSPPDRDAIQSELATLSGKGDWEAIAKGIRFANDGTTNSKSSTIPQSGSCELNYKQLQQNFGIDFHNRTGGNL